MPIKVSTVAYNSRKASDVVTYGKRDNEPLDMLFKLINHFSSIISNLYNNENLGNISENFLIICFVLPSGVTKFIIC